jgi:hypothetical protein
MPDFSEVLSKPMDLIEKPKARPIGTFIASIVGVPKQKVVQPRDGGEGMPVITFNIKRTSAVQLDDPDQAADHPPIGEWSQLQHDIFLHTEAGQWQFKQFLKEVLGLNVEGKTGSELLAETPGRQLVVKTKHEAFTSKAGEPGISERIESVAHA